MKLIFASQNKHKLDEVLQIAGDAFEIMSLNNFGLTAELPETHFTLHENAEEKAEFVYQHYRMDCFAEDTGLEIQSLNGEPGVFSARYAGPMKTAADNIELVLQKLKGIKSREAVFRTVICLILEGRKFFFEGSITGTIAMKSKGAQGFGYDPIFIPESMTETYAELTAEIKNQLSHRRRALEKMVRFIKG